MENFSATVFLLTNLLVLGGAVVVVHRYYDFQSLAERLLSIFVLSLAQVSATVLFCGLVVRNLSIPALALAHAGLSVLVLLLLRKHVFPAFVRLAAQVKQTTGQLLTSRDPFYYAGISLFLVQVGLTLRKIYYLPPYVLDDLHYRLPPVAEWLQLNQIPITSSLALMRVNSTPLNASLLSFWFVRFGHDYTWIEVPQFLFSLVIVLCSYRLMRLINVKREAAILYAVLAYFVPMILIESRTAQDHLMICGLFLLAMVFLIRAFLLKEWRCIWLAGLALGILLGTKLSGPLYILVLVISLVWAMRASLIPILRARQRVIAGMLLVCIALGGFWYVRNLLVYHAYSGAFRFRMPAWTTGVDLSSNYPLSLLTLFARNWSDLPSRLLDSANDYHADAAWISGFGLQFFAFGLPAYLSVFLLALWGRLKNKIVWFTLVAALVLQMLSFALYYSPFNYRLFIVTAVLGIVLWAYVASLMRFSVMQRRYLGLVALLALGFSFCTTYYSEQTVPAKWRLLFEWLPRERRTTTAYRSPSQADWEIVDQYIPPGEPLGVIEADDLAIFPYYDITLRRPIRFLGSDPTRTGVPPDLAERMRKNRVRLVVLPGATVTPGAEFRHIQGHLYRLE